MSTKHILIQPRALRSLRHGLLFPLRLLGGLALFEPASPKRAFTRSRPTEVRLALTARPSYHTDSTLLSHPVHHFPLSVPLFTPPTTLKMSQEHHHHSISHDQYHSALGFLHAMGHYDYAAVRAHCATNYTHHFHPRSLGFPEGLSLDHFVAMGEKREVETKQIEIGRAHV